jgi:hypothetical protein
VYEPETETNRKISIRIRFDSIQPIFDSIRFDPLFEIPNSIQFDSTGAIFDSIRFDSYIMKNRVFSFSVVLIVRVCKNDFVCLPLE